jgi:hypothetical protein
MPGPDRAGPDPLAAQRAQLAALEEQAQAGQPSRARDVCRHLGTGEEPRHVEDMRRKLKRLAARGMLDETTPGLFTPRRPPENA